MALTGAVAVQAPAAAAGLDGTYAIKNKKSGLCVDVPGYGAGYAGAPVTQFRCNFTTADNQRWTFLPRGTFSPYAGAPSYNQYVIRNAKDGLCLDVPGVGDNPNGALVSEYRCAGDSSKDNQRWYTVVRTASDGRTGVWIVNSKSRKCLDVAGYGAGSGARLTLYTCTDSKADDHYWSITSKP
ncbi:RICIN domain-containing protein [Kineococcus sp. G2]|uniref:RICIN domain-containing protein n=1 Tax=Kineococcus sp. G2 TaxID=3127484 RepID=UPI00301B7364